jgi:hypothetical protein
VVKSIIIHIGLNIDMHYKNMIDGGMDGRMDRWLDEWVNGGVDGYAWTAF